MTAGRSSIVHNLGVRGVEMVCFDLGGVLARINRTWQGAAAAAGVQISLRPEIPMGLGEIACFDAFQTGQLGLDTYLEGLAQAFGVTCPQALEIHAGILIGPYEGTTELVVGLRSAGIRTGCLSNTNAPHWAIMLSQERFPNIAALDVKMASHEVKLQKPDPKIFCRFAADSGLSPDRIVFFDDDPANVQAAVELGWQAHLIDGEGDTAAQMGSALESLG